MRKEDKVHELLQQLQTKEMEMAKQRDLASALTNQAIMKNNSNIFPGMHSQRSEVDDEGSVISSQFLAAQR